MRIGADYIGENRCEFTLWAPEAGSAVLHTVHPRLMEFRLDRDEQGYRHAVIAVSYTHLTLPTN